MQKFSIKNVSVNAKVLAISFASIFIIGIVINPNFLSLRNFMSIFQQMTEIGIMSIGMTMVILTGGIDISIGTSMGLSAIITGACMSMGMPVLASVLLSLVVSILCGALNALMIAVIGVPAMIATLGTQMFFNGVALAISEGGSLSGIPESFYFLGQGQVFGFMPTQTIIFIVIAIGAHIMLTRKRLGKKIYAIGNNSEAAKYAGIRTVRVLLAVYIICSLLCCIAGNIQVARVTTARADMGTVYMMQCISAVVFGGTSILGGKGGIGGTIVGVMVFAMIGNIMNLAGVSAHWQQFVSGLIMIIVLVFNRTTEKRHLMKIAK